MKNFCLSASCLCCTGMMHWLFSQAVQNPTALQEGSGLPWIAMNAQVNDLFKKRTF